MRGSRNRWWRATLYAVMADRYDIERAAALRTSREASERKVALMIEKNRQAVAASMALLERFRAPQADDGRKHRGDPISLQLNRVSAESLIGGCEPARGTMA